MSNQEELKLHPAYTACRYCVFAKYDGNKQTDCSLGKIDQYRQAGTEIAEVYDEDREFFIINGRFCMYYRNEEVMKNIPESKYIETVTRQVSVPYHAIIFVEHDTTLVEVKETIKYFKEHRNKPRFVTIVNKQPYYNPDLDNSNFIKPSDLLQLISEFDKYSLRNIYEQNMDDRDIIDIVFDSAKKWNIHSYITFRAGFKIPVNFIDKFEQAIFIDMKTVCFVEPYDDLNGMIVNCLAHKKHAGNSFLINLEKKIRQFEPNPDKLIFKANDLCPLS